MSTSVTPVHILRTSEVDFGLPWCAVLGCTRLGERKLSPPHRSGRLVVCLMKWGDYQPASTHTIKKFLGE